MSNLTQDEMIEALDIREEIADGLGETAIQWLYDCTFNPSFSFRRTSALCLAVRISRLQKEHDAVIAECSKIRKELLNSIEMNDRHQTAVHKAKRELVERFESAIRNA
jgi:hypothetical protein